MKRTDRDREPLREPIAAAIGHVIARWSSLERVVHLAFGILLGIDKDLSLSISVRLGSVETLFEILDESPTLTDKDKATLRPIAKKIISAKNTRNAVAHSLWLMFYNSDHHMIGWPEVRRKWTRPKTQTTAALLAQAAAILEVEELLEDFLIERGTPRRTLSHLRWK